MEDYLLWRSLEQSKSVDDKKLAVKYREEMKTVELKVTDEQIIDIRKVAV